MERLSRAREKYVRGVENGLDDIAQIVLGHATEVITEDAFDEGTLARSGEVRTEPLKRIVAFTAAHAFYVHDGTGPRDKFPPPDAIRGWVRRKLGITGQRELESVTWAVMTKIKNEGTEAVPFFTIAKAKVKPRLKRIMAKAVNASLRGEA